MPPQEAARPAAIAIGAWLYMEPGGGGAWAGSGAARIIIYGEP